MKILTVCAYGNVRSQATARQLKDGYLKDASGIPVHFDVLAAGLVANTPSTLLMLFEWADVVLNASEGLSPAEYAHTDDIPHEKFHDLELGMDRWGEPSHPELVELVRNRLDGLRPILGC